MKSIDLIQPRHNYAPPPEVERLGHVYLPTSLHTPAARLMHAGIQVTINDENLHQVELSANNIGINLLGAPYIPEVIRLQHRLRQKTNEKLTFVLGGQVMRQSEYGFSRQQISTLFGTSSIIGNDDVALSGLLGIDPQDLPRPEDTSLIPVYERINDADMLEYLSREFSFYVSQGCNQNCSFCAAEKFTPERYRAFDVMEKDLSYLVSRAIKLGLNELNIYMSNLDVIQNPRQLDRFADAVISVKENNPGFQIHLHGLATVPFFNKFKVPYRDTIRKLSVAGFHTVGFGVDGWDDALWKKLRKGNTKDDCVEAIRDAREEFGLTPELLMVFGHEMGDKKDTPESLHGAYRICMEMCEEYGAIPRPHVSKCIIPGNEGWILPENRDRVASLIRDPESFQSLDFTALPSPITHLDPKIRALATYYYKKICEIPESTTLWTEPIYTGMSDAEIEAAKSHNIGRYDR